MIGGDDIVIDGGRAGLAEREAIVRVFTKHWPDALMADANSRLDAQPLNSTFTEKCFVYRDRASREAWERDGWTEAYADAMVHVLMYANSLTLVVHHIRTSQTAMLAAEIDAAIQAVRAGRHQCEGCLRYEGDGPDDAALTGWPENTFCTDCLWAWATRDEDEDR